jgi:2-amino-4-hydroxy-6-hydroxymethyldihydropteridine diphosphokinase
VHRAYLALGSNMGDKVAMLTLAMARISTLSETRAVARSSLYRTPPWGKLDQDWFANAVIAVETVLTPEALLEACLAIEFEFGRERSERWGPRLLDIDLLLHGDARRSSPSLTLPHPAMLERAFVLVPLLEIAPDLLLDGVLIKSSLARLDSSKIEKIASL